MLTSDLSVASRVRRCVGAALTLLVAVAGAARAQSGWTVTDLGTLPGTEWATTYGMNNAGDVVGVSVHSDQTSSIQRAFLWTPSSGMTDLGTLGGETSVAYDINDARQIVGLAATANGEQHAFLKAPGSGMIDLGTLGGPSSAAVAINEVGQVVGMADTPSWSHAFVWTPSTGMIDLGVSGYTSAARGINNAGHVIGYTIYGLGVEGAFLWTPSGGMVNLGTLPGTNSCEPLDINDAGQVVGTCRTAGAGSSNRAFLWTASGGMVALPGNGGWSVAWQINEAGQVVGREGFDGSYHAVVWTVSGGFTDLGTLGGNTSVAWNINDAGQVIGESQTTPGEFNSHGFAWTAAGGMEDLARNVSAYHTRVNNEGVVAGSAAVGDELHLLVWRRTGAPGPASFGKVGPSNGAIGQPSSLTLSWGTSTGATGYQYCYDTTNDNVCSVWISAGTSTSVALSGLAPNTTYYWQVRATNTYGAAYGEGAIIAFWSFTTTAFPLPFSKGLPANGATGQSTNLTLTWGASSGASGYQYCYDTTNDNACSVWTSAGTSTSVGVSGLTPGATYYWQVRATNASGVTYANGGFWTFAVGALPLPFGKTAPANGAIQQPMNPVLSWGASSGASGYQYCYDTSNDNACSAWTSTGTSRSVGLNNLSPGVTYYWQVRATSAYGFTYADGGAGVFWNLTITPGNPKDLVIDFGPAYGLWLLVGTTWTNLHNLSPVAMVTGSLDGNSADDLVVNFGPGIGVYAWMNHASWVFLHPLSPSHMVTGDLDHNGHDDIVFVFPGAGVWRWSDGAWSLVHGLDPTALAVGNLDGQAGEDLVLDFPVYGLYVLANNQTWRFLHGLHVEAMLTADLDGSGQDELLLDFGPLYGLWAYRNNATWSQLHSLSPTHLAAGDIDGNGLADLVIDFGPGYGLWTYRNSSTWAQRHPQSAEILLLTDRDGNQRDEIIIDFGTVGLFGLYQVTNDTTWTRLHPTSPQLLAAGRFH